MPGRPATSPSAAPPTRSLSPHPRPRAAIVGWPASPHASEPLRADSVAPATLSPLAAAPPDAPPDINEKERAPYLEAAFSDAVAIYLLSLALDFDYSELREREYPLLTPAALAARLRCIAELYPTQSHLRVRRPLPPSRLIPTAPHSSPRGTAARSLPPPQHPSPHSPRPSAQSVADSQDSPAHSAHLRPSHPVTALPPPRPPP